MDKGSQLSEQTRECGSCTVCCEGWINIDVNGTLIHPGHGCPNISAKGCKIYETRPQVCRGFACSWLKNDLGLADWMKPDNSRAIVQQLHGIAVVTTIPVGKKISTRALSYLKELADKRQFALVYYERIKENGKFSEQMIRYNYVPSGCQSELDKLQRFVDHITPA